MHSVDLRGLPQPKLVAEKQKDHPFEGPHIA